MKKIKKLSAILAALLLAFALGSCANESKINDEPQAQKVSIDSIEGVYFFEYEGDYKLNDCINANLKTEQELLIYLESFVPTLLGLPNANVSLNLNFKGGENTVKSICWVMSYLSWLLLVATGWASITKENVGDVFNALNKKLVNAGAIGTKVAKVTADVYAAIIDSGLATTAKNADVNMADQEVTKFKGFIIEEIPEDVFQTGEVIYAYIAGVGKFFTGINIVRTVQAVDFAGNILQGAGKAGEYLPKDNKKVVLKVAVTGA